MTAGTPNNGPYVSVLPTTVDQARRRLGIKRNGYTPCAVDGCDQGSPGHPAALFRVNPKGQEGVFMCEDHAETERMLHG